MILDLVQDFLGGFLKLISWPFLLVVTLGCLVFGKVPAVKAEMSCAGFDEAD